MKHVYRSEDGKLFDTEKECLEYEEKKSPERKKKVSEEIDKTAEEVNKMLKKLSKLEAEMREITGKKSSHTYKIDIDTDELSVVEAICDFMESVLA